MADLLTLGLMHLYTEPKVVNLLPFKQFSSGNFSSSEKGSDNISHTGLFGELIRMAAEHM